MNQDHLRINKEKTIARVVEEYGGVKRFCQEHDIAHRKYFYRVFEGVGFVRGARGSLKIFEILQAEGLLVLNEKGEGQ